MINKPISNLRKIIFSSLMIIGCFSFLTSTVKADNKDVQDNAHVLNTKTQDYIEKINEDDLNKIKGHPQIAVITQKSLNGEDLDQRAQDLFDKYKFGHKGYDNGILFLIITGDHKMRMQTGYGVEAAVPDTFINELVAGDIKKDLQAGDYNNAVTRIVDKTAKRLSDHKNELLDKEEVAQEEKAHPHKSGVFSSITKSISNFFSGNIFEIVGRLIKFIKNGLLFLLMGVVIFIGAYAIIVVVQARKSLKSALRAANVPKADFKKMLNEAFDAGIEVNQVPIFIRFFNYNKKLDGKKLAWSKEMLYKISNLSFDEYKKLIDHYNQALEAGRKIENYSEDDFLNYLGNATVLASLRVLLSENFDPEKLGKKWNKKVQKAKTYKERVAEETNRDKDSWFFGNDSSGDSSDFGGDGGDSGGGGGDASW